MKPELLAPISQAFATLGGAVFVLVGIWYKERIEAVARAKNARIQIVAEIRALLDLIELNGYLGHVRDMIAKLRAGGFTYLNFSSNRSFVSVYEANLQNLGHLEGSASEVVRFYMILLSSLEDKDTIAEQGKRIQASGAAPTEHELHELTRRHESFYAKLAEVVRIGEKLCAELHYVGGRPQKLKLPKAAKSSRRWGFRRKAVPASTGEQPAVH